MALISAAQEAVWIQQLIGELRNETARPMTINEDNHAAIQMSKNPQFNGCGKHIGTKYHFILEQIVKGTVRTNLLANQ